MRLFWCVCLLLSVAIPAARAEEPLVPEGESLDVLQNADWTPLSGLRAVATSPDGAQFVTVSDDGLVRLWSSAGQLLRQFSTGSEGLAAVAYSGDGKIVAIGGRDGALRLWDPATGQVISSTPVGEGVTSVTLNHDGKAFVTVGARRAASLWRSAAGSAGTVVPEKSGEARSAQFSSDGKQLAIGLADRTVVVLDGEGRKVLKTINGFDAAPSALAFSADLRSLAVGLESGSIRIVELSTGRTEKVLDGHAQNVTGLRWMDGLLASGALDGSVRLWNANTWQDAGKLSGGEGCCARLGALDSGSVLVTVTPTSVLRWNVASRAALPKIGSRTASVTAVSSDSAGQLVLVGTSDGVLRLFDTATGTPRQRWTVAGTVDAAAISPDGKFIATASAHSVRLWDTATGKEVKSFDGLDGVLTSLRFSSDSSRLLASGTDKVAHIWNVKTATLQADLQTGASVSASLFAWDASTVVTASGNSVRTWAADKGVESKKVAFDAEVTALALSNDGKVLLVGLADGSIRRVDAVTGVAGPKFNGHTKRVTGLAFFSDGKRFMSSSLDDTLRVSAIDGGTESAKLELRGAGPRALVLTGNDSIAFVSTNDGAVVQWNPSEKKTGALFRSSVAGWVAQVKDRVLRGDLGTYVMHVKGDAGAVESVEPAAPDASPNLSMELGPASPAGDGTSGKIVLRIKNAAGAGRAYWVTVEPVGQLPAGLSVWKGEPVPRLEPGTSVEIPVNVGWMFRGASPAPHEERVSFRLAHAHGELHSPINASVHIRSAKIDSEVIAVEGDSTTPFIRVQVTNSGDEASGPLSVAPVFVADGAEVWAAPVVQIKNLQPGDKTLLGIAATPEVSKAKASLKLMTSGSLSPSYQWTETLPLERKVPWKPLAATAVLVLMLLAVLYVVRVSRHPIVLQLSKDGTQLRRYSIHRFPEVQKVLSRARRLDAVLTAARISEGRWKRAVAVSKSPEEAVSMFAETIGARRQPQSVTAGQPAWVCELPALALRFPREAAIVAVTGQTFDTNAATSLASALQSAGGITAAIALDLTVEQNAAELLQSMPRLSFVVLNADETRDMLLADQPLELLQNAIGTQRPLAELSPYQATSGLEEDGLFFGREKELRAIADRVLRNFIIVAPRQMGKSSLLKAIHRRLLARPDVEVQHITLFEDDLAGRVAKVLNRPRPETAEQFVEVAAGTRRKPRVWLIDEADSFIVKDARNKYPIAQAMRTLAEEGRAFFVLAGFWHLYAAAFLNPNNPLRNFGELLRLEPLDRDSARQLATKPMTAMGLDYEDAALVDRLLDNTACRAHLIAAVCKTMLDRLGVGERVLTAAHVDDALHNNPALYDEFKYWRREPLGRALVRAILLRGPATRAELRDRLKEFGLDAPTELFSATLDRLELGFLLTANDKGKLSCPVPILKRFIEQEDGLREGLQRDVKDFLASGANGGEAKAVG